VSEHTAMQAAAADRLEEINARLDEIDSQIDRAACWNPTVETDADDMALAEEYDELLGEKQDCQRLLPDHGVGL